VQVVFGVFLWFQIGRYCPDRQREQGQLDRRQRGWSFRHQTGSASSIYIGVIDDEKGITLNKMVLRLGMKSPYLGGTVRSSSQKEVRPCKF